jgi:hypothetical protein
MGRERRRGVLQLGELDLVTRREEVRSRRQDLTELDEGGSKFFERPPHMFRAGQRLIILPVEKALPGDKSLEAKDADEESEAMAGQNPADLPVPTCRRGSRHRP